MSVTVPLLDRDQIDRLPARARDVVEYRKSGLSLNHIQGCPLDCAYCIRHTYGLWDQRQPRAMMTDAEAVEALVTHRYFQPHVTPTQLFNRATDPFLPAVRGHTFAVLEDLDSRGLSNHVLVITRQAMKPEDADRLDRLQHLKITLLFTYSGIDNQQIEPYPSTVAADSLRLMSARSPRRYRTILYWRPLVPGLNDSDEHLDRAYELAQHADATVFTGLFYRDQIADYYRANGLPEPYDATARRKIVPEMLERRVLAAFADAPSLFRKTSCAVSFAHGLPDYNGHYGIRELCDVCPMRQLDLCRSAHRVSTAAQIHEIARVLPEAEGLTVVDITERAAIVSGLAEEQPRATTCNTSSAFRCTTNAIRTMSVGTAALRSDGRATLKMADWMSLRYVVVDVEGNGQQRPELVELGLVPIVDGLVGTPSSWLVRPQRPITPMARKVHGILNEDVASAPAFADIRSEVLDALENAVLVAHNAHVDVAVLQRTLGDWQCPEVFDTLKLARRLLPDQSTYRLGALVDAFGLAVGLPDGLTPHRATYDVLVTARLFVHLAASRSLDELRGMPPEGDRGEAAALF